MFKKQNSKKILRICPLHLHLLRFSQRIRSNDFLPFIVQLGEYVNTISCFVVVQMDEFEIQQHYDEFFEEVYVEMEKVSGYYFYFSP